jgi:uncharacterized protein DUF2795
MASTEIWAYRGVPTTVEMTGFSVEAADGSIGTIDEATAERGESYLVVDTGPWIFGKRVLLPAGVVERIDVAEEKVFINRSREDVRNAPEYDPDAGVSAPFRQRVGSYYAERERGQSRPQRSQSAQQRSQTRQTRVTRKSTSSSSRARGGASRRTRGQTSDEPTRDELYEQAKRLGIEGRSKMNKAELKRAVGRRSGQSSGGQRVRSSSSQARTTRGSGEKANPVEVQSFLEGVSYPTRKGDLIREAERQGASRSVRSTLERLPDERFEDPTEVSEAVGKLR